MRRQTVENPFGTLKAWMRSTHFLTKTFPKVRPEKAIARQALVRFGRRCRDRTSTGGLSTRARR